MISIVAEGIGFGHIRRCMRIARELEKTDEVEIITYGKAADVSRQGGFETKNLGIDFSLRFGKKNIDIEASAFDYIMKVNFPVISKLHRQFRRDRPKAVLIDSSVSALVASKLAGIKNVAYLANQTDFSNFPAFTMVKKSARYLGRQVAQIPKVVIVPDLPPPYSICLKNLDFHGKREKFRFVGGIANRYPKGSSSKKAIAFGGEEDGGILDELGQTGLKMQTASKALASRYKNLELKEDFEQMASAAGIIITHGGHTTLMECIISGKAIVGIALGGYAEREANLGQIAALGLGERLEPGFVNKKTLEFAFQSALKKGQESALLRRFAQSFDGAKLAAGIIRDEVAR
ncbi:hypothetical protein FJZ26_02075 [Candidatus Parvarchaeota archaeon]|nr:hypothetical protein [Candidatus Parvarchaeota archaeon]